MDPARVHAERAREDIRIGNILRADEEHPGAGVAHQHPAASLDPRAGVDADPVADPQRGNFRYPGRSQRGRSGLPAGFGRQGAHPRRIVRQQDDPVHSLFEDPPVERHFVGSPRRRQDPAPPGDQVFQGDHLPVAGKDDPDGFRRRGQDRGLVRLSLHLDDAVIPPLAVVPFRAGGADPPELPRPVGTAVGNPHGVDAGLERGDRDLLVPRDDPRPEDGSHHFSPALRSPIASGTVAPPWTIATMALTTVAGDRCWKPLLPMAAPAPPAATASRSIRSTCSSLSIFSPPAITTGLAHPSTTSRKVSGLPVYGTFTMSAPISAP